MTLPERCYVPRHRVTPPAATGGRGGGARLRHGLTVAARVAATALAVIVGVVGLGLAVAPRTGAYQTVTMLTGSMRPHMPVGSVLVVRPQPTTSLHPGQVLTYSIPVLDHRVVSHRVVSIRPSGDGFDVVTKGDANPARDPWTAHIKATQVWTVRAVVPHAGDALLILRDRRFLPWLLYGAPAVCLAWVLVGLWRPERG